MSNAPLIARQPIFNSNLKVIAYELLFREHGATGANVTDDCLATAQVLVNTFMEIGMDQVIGKQPAFINVGRDFIVSEDPLPLPVERVVIEVLENVEPDDEVEEGLKRLSNQGFKIALDDFEYEPKFEGLMDIANIVKIDVFGKQEAEVLKDISHWKQRGNVKLLAEKVETREEFETYRKMGFDYFQGYFFAKPENILGTKAPSNRMTTLKLLAELQNPEADIPDMEQIIRRDAALSYKLLRYINTARFSLARQVESIREALTYIGVTSLRRWVTIIALTGSSEDPSEMITTALVRARMCENLAVGAKRDYPDMYFTVGLFSALEVILGIPMVDIVEQLPMGGDINDALLEEKGPMGEALICALMYEQWSLESIQFATLTQKEIGEAYVEALGWAISVEKEME